MASTAPNDEDKILQQDFVDRIEIATQKIRDVVRGNIFHPIQDVELLSYEEVDVTFPAQTRFLLQREGGEKVIARAAPGLQKIKSRGELDSLIEKDIEKAVTASKPLENLKAAVLEREDQGYFWNDGRLPLDINPLEYLREEPCQTCRGLKYVECVDCHGRGMIKCRNCFGKTGGACKICHGRGEEQCLKCQTKGKRECFKCKAHGIINFVTSVKLSANATSSYDKEDVPDLALPILERLKDKLITKEHAIITNISDDIESKKKDHADAILTLNYDVNFPLGDAVFRVGEEEVPALVFGYKTALLDVPPFLERYMLAPFNLLREAAEGLGDVAAKVRAATFQTRLTNEVVMGVARYGVPKTEKHLKHEYSIALEPQFISSLVKAARGALDRLTTRPQIIGLIFGFIPAFLLTLLYVFVFDAGGIGTSQPLRLLADIIFLGVTCFLPYVGAQIMARQSLVYALGERVKNTIKLPKLGTRGAIGPLLVVILFLIFSEFAYRENPDAASQLYSLFRSAIG